jgi:hypothetical protein
MKNFFTRLMQKTESPTVDLEAQRAAHIAADAAAAKEVPLPAVIQPPEPIVVAEQAVMDDVTKKERARALSDPLYLANEVLGYELAPEHEILLSVLLDHTVQDVLVLWARGSGKTTCLAVAIVRELLINPNQSIAYVIGDIDLGERRLRQIADCFENPTPKFRKLFPEACGLERCIAREFTVLGRTDRALVDPSLLITSITTNEVGGHFGLLVLDDVVTTQNVLSETSRENTFQRYQLLRGTRTAGARVILSGTVNHERDVYSRIRADVEKRNDPTWRISIQGATHRRCQNCTHKQIWHTDADCILCQRAGHSCPIFIAGEPCPLIDAVKTKRGEILGFTLESIAQEKTESRMGYANAMRQLEMVCDPTETTQWRPWSEEMLAKLFGQPETFFGNLGKTFIVVDAALREGSDKPMPEAMRPDLTVGYLCQMRGNVCRVLACLFNRWNIPETGRQLALWNATLCGSCPMYLESTDFPSLKFHIQHHQPQIEVYELPADNRTDAKLHRQIELQDAVIADRLQINLDPVTFYGAIQHLNTQLKAFPKQVQGHDDFRDGLSLIQRAVNLVPAASNPLRPPLANSPANFARSLREERENAANNFDDGYGSSCF